MLCEILRNCNSKYLVALLSFEVLSKFIVVPILKSMSIPSLIPKPRPAWVQTPIAWGNRSWLVS